jgi:hypothetical protein
LGHAIHMGGGGLKRLMESFLLLIIGSLTAISIMQTIKSMHTFVSTLKGNFNVSFCTNLYLMGGIEEALIFWHIDVLYCGMKIRDKTNWHGLVHLGCIYKTIIWLYTRYTIIYMYLCNDYLVKYQINLTFE